LIFLKKVSDRLWIPHQVAFEFHKNRLNVISSQKEAYGKLEAILNSYKKKIDNELKGYLIHAIIQIKQYITKFSNLFEKTINDLKKQEKEHPDLFTNDIIREHITKLFKEKVGEKYSDDRLKQIYEEGKIRYEKKYPLVMRMRGKKVRTKRNMEIYFYGLKFLTKRRRPKNQ
jgi:hypothetical protein